MKNIPVLFLLTLCINNKIKSQNKSWKALGPFSIHKTIGSVEAPGLGVMRSLDVSAKNPNG